MDQSVISERSLIEQQQFRDDPLWYQDAIIYQLHVKAFYDSNSDGIGDFAGLTQKLDYLRDLSVNTIWLLPFYPSPLKDDGYDIADYRNVNPNYGTMVDFRHFMREAHRRGLKVITELVINHTSDQHPWFQAARRAPPGSHKRDYYVWSDTDKKWPETRIIFTDTESSNWAWDPIAKAYYWHRFFSHQPDLNFANPSVVKAIMRVMRFWLDAGVDGMRLDAVPYLRERDGTNNENLPETHEVLKYMRAELDRNYRNRLFLGEINQWPEDVREYFGNGDECHMAYHFPLMPRIYMAVAQEDRHPIIDIMAQTPDIPPNCQWAIFLRNHDELTLEMVTDRERDYMYKMYAADQRARINLGIRRRLAPLMENNPDKIKLVNSLLFSMPGSPIVYYGDELGMGDNVYLGDRNGVRTPMQWSPDRNAGFSRADPARLYLPPIMDAVYGYQSVNVEAQLSNQSSLLNWMRRIIAVRKAHQAFGRGKLTFIRPGNRKILVYLREHANELILCVANLSRSSQPVELDLKAWKGRVPVELLGRTPFPPIGELPYFLTLPGYSFYWFLLATDVAAPNWHAERTPSTAELPVLVMPEGWRSLVARKEEAGVASSDVRALLANKMRLQAQRDALPIFIAAQRWFAGKGQAIEAIELVEANEWQTPAGTWLLAFCRATSADGGIALYALPFALAWEEAREQRLESLESLRHCAVARIRQHNRVGVLFDAFWDDAFCRAIAQGMRRGTQVPFGSGRLELKATTVLDEVMSGATIASLEVKHPALEQSNTAVMLGDQLILKGYRRLQQGINPEIEIGRFLTEISPFANIAPLAGSIEYVDAKGNIVALGILQKQIANQGSGWSYTTNYLQRFLETRLATGSEPAVEDESPHATFLPFVETLARRTAELHRALARTTGDAAFDPEPITPADVQAWVAQVREDVARSFEQLRERRSDLPEVLRVQADRLLGLRAMALDWIARLEPIGVDLRAAKTRLHGDYHLGQVLVVKNDIVIIDFEGEPARPVNERREKLSPLRDVAGMLRSFSYAAASALNSFALERAEQRLALQPEARRWEREMAAVFLAEYREGMAGCESYPVDAAHAEALLDFFLMEKALYELRYELNNRPDWVSIPLNGLVELIEAKPNTTETSAEDTHTGDRTE